MRGKKVKETETKPFMVRQGDVLLIETKIPKNVKRIEVDDRLVLAEGEVTGHVHAIDAAFDFAAFEDTKGNMFIRLNEPAELVHEEHGTIQLPAVSLQRVMQRQENPFTRKGMAIGD